MVDIYNVVLGQMATMGRDTAVEIMRSAEGAGAPKPQDRGLVEDLAAHAIADAFKNMEGHIARSGLSRPDTLIMMSVVMKGTQSLLEAGMGAMGEFATMRLREQGITVERVDPRR